MLLPLPLPPLLMLLLLPPLLLPRPLTLLLLPLLLLPPPLMLLLLPLPLPLLPQTRSNQVRCTEYEKTGLRVGFFMGQWK